MANLILSRRGVLIAVAVIVVAAVAVFGLHRHGTAYRVTVVNNGQLAVEVAGCGGTTTIAPGATSTVAAVGDLQRDTCQLFRGTGHQLIGCITVHPQEMLVSTNAARPCSSR